MVQNGDERGVRGQCRTDHAISCQARSDHLGERNVLISGFYIKFCYQGTWAITGNHANNLVDVNILARKILRINAVVHAGTPQEDKSTIKRHLLGWPFLGMTPKLLICKRGNGEEEKGPATLPRETSLAKYASTMWAW